MIDLGRTARETGANHAGATMARAMVTGQLTRRARICTPYIAWDDDQVDRVMYRDIQVRSRTDLGG